MERLDAFMARANAAYYAAHDPFRDFTTSPEISQVFGEILGAWAAVVWEQIGRPDPVLLVEAGPGRGTLMADALRAIGQVAPAFGSALRVHLIETSERLRATQAERVPGAVWHEGLENLPLEPFVLVANEFLDALPIRQFVQRGDDWAERFVHEGRFVEVPVGCPEVGQRRGLEEREGGTDRVVELNEPARAIARAIGARFADRPGAAVFLDYGPERSAVGDSLQALRGGRPANP